MNIQRIIGLAQSIIVLLLCTTALYSQGLVIGNGVEVTGNSSLEFATADTSESRFLESWTDLFLSKNDFRLGVRLGVHEPPAFFSNQDTTSGIEHLFGEYRKGSFYLRAGNFYSLLGRGLVLRSFENRTLRWDNNLRGAKAEINHRYADLEILAGEPRKARLGPDEQARKTPAEGIRLPWMYGGELKLKPSNKLSAGGIFLHTESQPQSDNASNRSAAFLEVNLPQGGFYGEYATTDLNDGKGLYLSANLFLGELSLLGEYRNYENIGFEEGLLNNPPTVFQEHLFTLLNRQQLIQNPNDERGFLIEAGYPLSEYSVLTSSYSRTENKSGFLIYEDIFAQYEHDDFLGGEWVWATGRQEDLLGRYLNWVTSASYDFGNYKSLKLTYEHQHAKFPETATFSTRQHYDQLLTMEVGLASGLGISFLGEHSTDQFADLKSLNDDLTSKKKHHYWIGGQIDATFAGERFQTTLFAGQRRKGKVCIGGVCVVKPELEGLELIFTARL